MLSQALSQALSQPSALLVFARRVPSPLMSERDDYQALFLAHLPFIDRAAAATARALGLRVDDAEEFASWTRERLWEDDYRVLRKWRGDSRLTTFLTTRARRGRGPRPARTRRTGTPSAARSTRSCWR